ncbi:MAG: hypothetical protein FJ125_05990 [Deltaproteobacteria bacterium]|nr:hypothetical protein [Deltaproteobacteria bacterium]
MKGKLIAITVLSLALLVPGLAFAKIKLQKSRFGEPGKFTVGGGIEYYSYSDKATEPESADLGEGSSMVLAPQIGYFVMKGLEVGGILEYGTMNYKAEGADDDSGGSKFALGPMLAYYFKVSPILHPYLRGYYVHTLSESTEPDDKQEHGGYKYGVGGGVALAIGHKVGGVLKLGLDYATEVETTKPEKGDERESQQSGIRLASSICVYF